MFSVVFRKYIYSLVVKLYRDLIIINGGLLERPAVVFLVEKQEMMLFR